MYNRRYDKKFLMLRQEVAGYSMGQKTPWGSCVIEIKNGKGTLNVRVQGLRPISKQSYDVYMIGGQERSIFCHALSLDHKGQGEFLYEFSPDGIGAYGVAIEDIHTIAVVVEDGRANHIVAPLVAYVDNKTDWKPYFKKTKKQEVETATKPVEIPQNKKPVPSEKANQKINQKATKTISTTTSQEDTKKVLLSFPVDNSMKSPYSGKRVSKISTEKESYTPKRIHTHPQQSDLHVAEYAEIATPQPFMMMPWERKVFQEESPDTYHGSFRGLIEKFRKELHDLENEGIFTENDMETIRQAGIAVDKPVDIMEIDVDIVDKNVGEAVDIVELSVDKPVDTVDKKMEMQELSTRKMESLARPKRFFSKNVNQIFKNHLKVQPFLETPNEVWTCITLDELLYISEIPIAWQRDLFFLYPMKKYGHLLYKEENGQHFIAVPIEKKDAHFFEKEAKAHAFHQFVEMQTSDLGYFVRCIG